MSSYAELSKKIEEQGAKIMQLKAINKLNPEISAQVSILKSLKEQLQKLEINSSEVSRFDRQAFEELMKKKMFYTPSFAIYGGVAGLFDYGPPGCAIQANVIDYWRKFFVIEEDMLELDTTILTPHEVLKTSGHAGVFFRTDHVVKNELESRLENHSKSLVDSKFSEWKLSQSQKEEYESILNQLDGYSSDQLHQMIVKFGIKSPNGNDLSEPEPFNLMFGTPIGPTGTLQGYLRPETAQGQFVNFKKLLEYNSDRMPFASAQIGRSFRNEISPRSGLLRVREFTMAEIEHYVNPTKKDHSKFHEVENVPLRLLPSGIQMKGKSDIQIITAGEAVSEGIVNNQTLAYFMVRIQQFLLNIGIKPSHLRFRQHLKHEMAHYACDCWDAEIKNSYGWTECVGCADRSAFDLTRHSEKTKERLVARENLDVPIVRDRIKLQIEKKLLGPSFKKDAKAVEEALNQLTEEELIKLKESLKEKGTAVVGSGYEVTDKMVSVVEVQETIYVNEYVPNVIEPSFGIGRILYCLLEHSWWIREGSETRNVLSVPAHIAPVKCLVSPIFAHESFTELIREIPRKLKTQGISVKVDDSAVKIGKKYSRADELGVPYAITIDFDTLKDGEVTLRERDSTKQIREKVEVIVGLVKSLSEGVTTWTEVETKYQSFVKEGEE